MGIVWTVRTSGKIPQRNRIQRYETWYTGVLGPVSIDLHLSQTKFPLVRDPTGHRTIDLTVFLKWNVPTVHSLPFTYFVGLESPSVLHSISLLHLQLILNYSVITTTYSPPVFDLSFSFLFRRLWYSFVSSTL